MVVYELMNNVRDIVSYLVYFKNMREIFNFVYSWVLTGYLSQWLALLHFRTHFFIDDSGAEFHGD